MTEKYYPSEENLGKDCTFWCLGGLAAGCSFPKFGLEGRRSCEGIIDDICLYIKDGRIPSSMTAEQRSALRTTLPNPDNLPPGETF